MRMLHRLGPPLVRLLPREVPAPRVTLGFPGVSGEGLAGVVATRWAANRGSGMDAHPPSVLGAPRLRAAGPSPKDVFWCDDGAANGEVLHADTIPCGAYVF
ncbi:MAG: hypothetical protein JW751_06615 [Polyangiaceae bacterium]|nr:hypothetical protein [Polyangiaceae bacterium]